MAIGWLQHAKNDEQQTWFLNDKLYFLILLLLLLSSRGWSCYTQQIETPLLLREKER